MIGRKLFLSTMVCFFVFSSFLANNPIDKGYECLNNKDYFSAKKYFQRAFKKNISCASFGLASIYFYSKDLKNLDSSLKYIELSKSFFIQEVSKNKKSLTYQKKYNWDIVQIESLQGKIANEIFDQIKRGTPNPSEVYCFTNKFTTYSFTKDAESFRDSIWLDSCSIEDHLCFSRFIQLFPDSDLRGFAQKQCKIKEYEEWVNIGSELELKTFLLFHNETSLISNANEDLYQLICAKGDSMEIERFIRTYPFNPNINAAWKKLYHLSTLSYNEFQMKRFIEEYPDYPFKANVLAELEMFNKVLYPCVIKEKYGFMDIDGVLRISADFQNVNEFNEGLSIATNNGLVGVIDKRGQVHVPFVYEFISDFQDGLALFRLDDLYGMMNRSGKIVIPNLYKDLGWLNDKVLYFKKDSLFGVMQLNGQVILNERFEEINIFKNGLSKVLENGFYGMINEDYSMVIPAIYSEIIPESNLGYRVGRDNKKGFIESTGKTVIMPENNEIGSVSEDFIMISKNQLFTHVDIKNWKKGRLNSEIYPDYIDKSRVIHGKFLVKKKNSFYWSDTVGVLSKALTYKNIGSCGVWVPVVKINEEKWGFIDRNGIEMSLFEFDFVQRINDELFIVTQNGKSGVISTNEGFIVPMEYDDIIFWNTNYLLVLNANKKGIFTLEGNQILNAEFDMIKSFRDNCWVLQKSNELMYYFIDNQQFLKLKK